METFYITFDQFWDWFDREHDPEVNDVQPAGLSKYRARSRNNSSDDWDAGSERQKLHFGSKRMKIDSKPRTINETEAASRTDCRYVIMYGPHKPGKKNKTWEGDGYLSLVGRMAHLCDLKGRMLEDPIFLDDIDYQSVEDMGELMIGNTEVQIVEKDN